MGKNKGTKTFPNTLVLVFAPLHSSLQKLLTFIFKRTFLFHIWVLSEDSPKASPDSQVTEASHALPDLSPVRSQELEKGRDQH